MYPKPDGWQGGADGTFMQQGNARPTNDEAFESWRDWHPDVCAIDFDTGE